MTSRDQYKRLGDYIHQIDVRNKDLAVHNLKGLSMTKEFRESTSNIVGVDLSKYKVVNPGVFAFDTMSVIRVHKVPIILNTGNNPVIISPAYITFVSNDENLLDSNYLRMWVRRQEFDRYADFKSDAAVRGGYGWDELCDTLIRIPAIEEQRRIVAEYQAVESRIATNDRLIAKLEETAQAIYKQMFVDDINPEHLPKDWRIGNLSDIANVSSGKSLIDKVDSPCGQYFYPVAGASGVIGYAKTYNQDEVFLTTGRVGTIGVVNRYYTKAWTADNVLVIKSDYLEYSYHILTNIRYEDIIKGGVQALVTQTDLNNVVSIVPPRSVLLDFENKASILSETIRLKNAENDQLNILKSLMLGKMFCSN